MSPVLRRSLIVCLVVLGSSAPDLAAVQAPRAVVDAPTRDLGVVGLGTEPVAEFTVRNTGAQVLELEAHSVPSPLRVVSADERIAAGKTGHVRFAVDTFQAASETEWRSTFTTNDPDRPFLELVVKVDVRQFLAVLPASARFTFVQHGREGGTTHVLSAVDDAKMEVLGVDSPFPFIRATWRELSRAERTPNQPGVRQWQINLTIASDAPVGPIGGNVIVRTTHPSQPRAFIPVSGFVRPLFAVTPPTVQLPAVQVTTDLPLLTLIVKNFGAEPLEITGTSSDVRGLDARVIVAEAGHVWHVELRMAPSAAGAAAQDGTLTLKTNHPEVPEVQVAIKRSGAEAR